MPPDAQKKLQVRNGFFILFAPLVSEQIIQRSKNQAAKADGAILFRADKRAEDREQSDTVHPSAGTTCLDVILSGARNLFWLRKRSTIN